MKRIILFCGLLLAATCTMNLAHAQKSGWPVIGSKTDFATKIAEFDDYMNKGKLTDAYNKIDEINLMITSQLRYGKYKIKDAADAGDALRLADAQKNIKDKVTIYHDLSNLLDNMTANKSMIDTKLNDFIKVMD